MPARILPFGPLTSSVSTLVDSSANPELMDRILRRSIEVPETGCFIWTGARATQGRYGITTVDGEPELAHRAAFLAYYGELPQGSLLHESESTEIHHTCTTRRCVHPGHLEAVTRREHNKIHTAIRSDFYEAKVAA